MTASVSQRGLAGVPYGVFSAGGAPPAVGARVGDAAIDLGVLARAGLYDGHVDDAIELFCAPSLNRLLARGRAVWSAARVRTLELIAAPPQRAIVPLSEATMLLPIEVADYVDFYASIEHATNLGKLFRPDGDPLLPNYRWIPIGYHGRAGTVVVSGTPIVRPRGQRKPPDVAEPSFGPSRMLDFELEVGFITGDGPPLGTPIPADRARDHIFGIVLLNDWSARDIQAWEYQPLGPFLGKSFATLISAWVVPLDALEPFRVAGPEQQPPPLDYLRTTGAQNYDIDLEASLATAAMTATGVHATVISRTNFRAMYWSMAQQLAHMSSNGSRVRAGDLYGSGTISGAEAGTYGSAIELTSRGTKPLALGDGTRRGFLEDGDTVTLRGWCGDGDERIDLGDVSGTIAPAMRTLEDLDRQLFVEAVAARVARDDVQHEVAPQIWRQVRDRIGEREDAGLHPRDAKGEAVGAHLDARDVARGRDLAGPRSAALERQAGQPDRVDLRGRLVIGGRPGRHPRWLRPDGEILRHLDARRASCEHEKRQRAVKAKR